MPTKQIPYDKGYYENAFARLARNAKRYQNRLRVIRETVKPGPLLEIGCGKGDLLSLVAGEYEAEGIDISSHAVEALRDRRAFRVRQDDIQVSPLEEDYYEGIAAFNVLEHLREPAPVLQKIVKALRPGGALIGSVPYNAAVLGRFHTLLTNIMDRTHVSTYSPDRWRGLFEEAGFRQVEFFGETNLAIIASWYLRGGLWNWFTLNLMFVCRK
jgi:SAM-dependent methyltransferase